MINLKITYDGVQKDSAEGKEIDIVTSDVEIRVEESPKSNDVIISDDDLVVIVELTDGRISEVKSQENK